MRHYFVFFISAALWIGTGRACAQGKQVLLLGTSHSFEKNPTQDFQPVIDKLVQFKPDLICIESIPAWDTVSLRKISSSQLKEVARILSTTGLSAKQVKDSLLYYEKKASKKNSTALTFSRLAFYNYLQHDFLANANYNWFLAVQSGDPNTTDTLLQKYLKTQKYTEYYNVVFPVAAKLKMKQLYGVDDRSDHPDDIKAQNETQGKLMAIPKGRELIGQYMKAQSDYAAAEKQGKVFELLNDEKYQSLISGMITNTYPDITTDESARKMKELWERRNMSIARRIVDIIKANKKNSRVVVSFGTAHIPLLKEYLTKLLPGYEVITYK